MLINFLGDSSRKSFRNKFRDVYIITFSNYSDRSSYRIFTSHNPACFFPENLSDISTLRFSPRILQEINSDVFLGSQILLQIFQEFFQRIFTEAYIDVSPDVQKHVHRMFQEYFQKILQEFYQIIFPGIFLKTPQYTFFFISTKGFLRSIFKCFCPRTASVIPLEVVLFLKFFWEYFQRHWQNCRTFLTHLSKRFL